MAEYEKVGQEKQEKVHRNRHISVLNSEPLSQNLMAWDISSYLIGEPPLIPPIQRYAAFISRASSEQRIIVARQLQQTYGNKYVQQLIKSMTAQTKLTVNPPDDRYEQEADRMAEAVTRSTSTKRQPDAKEEEEELQTKPMEGGETKSAVLGRSPEGMTTGQLPATDGKETLQPGGSQLLDISRESAPVGESKKEKKEGETKSTESKKGQEGEKKKSFDLVKELLGEKELEEYSKKLSEAAIEKLVTQVKGAKSIDDFTRKIAVAEIEEVLKANLDKTLVDLLKSPGGRKVQQAIREPAIVVAMILIAMGTAAVANPEIDLEKKLELGAGFKGDLALNMGKLKEISLNKLKAGFSYTSKYFETSVSGSYEAEKGKAEESAGTDEFKFQSPAEVDKKGNLKLDFRQVINWQTNSLTVGQSYESVKGWSGVLQLKLGNKYQYWTPKVTVDEDGKAKFELGLTFTNDIITLAMVLKGKEELSQKLDIEHPFGKEGISLSANYTLGLEDPKLKSAGLAAKIKLTEGKEGSPIPALSLKFSGKYQAAGPDKAEDLQGEILLVGHF